MITFYADNFQLDADLSAEPTSVGQNFTDSSGTAQSSGSHAPDIVDLRRGTAITIDTDGETTDFAIRTDITDNDRDYDFVIVDGHNLATADADIRVYNYSDASALTLTSSYSGALGDELTTESGSGYVNVTNDGLWLANFGTQNNLTDYSPYTRDTNSDNFDADITISQIFAGEKISPTVSPDIGIVDNSEYGIDVSEALGGSRYSTERHGERKGWKLSWSYISATDKATIEKLWGITRGNRYPFYIDLGEETNPKLYYVRFAQNKLSFKQVAHQVYSCNLEIETEI